MSESLLKLCVAIDALALTLAPPSNEPACPHCVPWRGCWLHPGYPRMLVAARKMTRQHWHYWRHLIREAAFARYEEERAAEADEYYNGRRTVRPSRLLPESEFE